MRSLALSLLLGSLGCARPEVTSVAPETIPSPTATRVGERIAAAQPKAGVGELVVIRGGTRLFADAKVGADWVETFSAREEPPMVAEHAYTIGRVHSVVGGFVEVELVGGYFEQFCFPTTPLTGYRGFVDEAALMLVTTKEVVLEEADALEFVVPPGTPVLRTDAADVLYTAAFSVQMRAPLEPVGGSFVATPHPNCVESQLLPEIDPPWDERDEPFAGVESIEDAPGGLAGSIFMGRPTVHVFSRDGHALGTMHLMGLEHTHGEADPNHRGRRCFPVTDVRGVPGGTDICASTVEMSADISALPKSKVVLISVDAEGVDDEEIREEVQKNAFDVSSCYGQLVLRDPKAEGEARVHVNLRTPSGAELISGSVEATHPEVQSCLERRILAFVPWRTEASSFELVYSYGPADSP